MPVSENNPLFLTTHKSVLGEREGCTSKTFGVVDLANIASVDIIPSRCIGEGVI